MEITLLTHLQGLNAYPIPRHTVDMIAVKRGLYPDQDVTYRYQDERLQRTVSICEADVYAWLSMAPDVAQGGQSYSFSDSERAAFRRKANALYRANGEEESVISDGKATAYGYKGDKL